MDITKVKLEGEAKEVFDMVSERAVSIQSEIDEQMTLFQAKAAELEKIKAMIRPLRAMASDVNQMQASIASRKSRAKYFPEFATKNYRADEKTDKAFLDKVRETIK